ncbi:MAG: transposase [Nodosilinea sp.]
MKYNPDKHHRSSIRLKGYDYSAAGAYFITICAFQRHCLFGQIVEGEMQLNEFGQIVAEEWLHSKEIRQEIDFDAWVIMPDHLHGVVLIESINPEGANNHLPLRQTLVGANGCLPSSSWRNNPHRLVPPMRPRSLASFIAGFKSATTKRINTLRDAAGTPVWQRNYYDHIIRNDQSLQHIRHYITNNPLTWADDKLHPLNLSTW